MPQTPPPQLPWHNRDLPVAVRRVVVPCSAPPYDDEQHPGDEPDTAKPDTAKPDTAEPDTAEPNAAEADPGDRSDHRAAELGGNPSWPSQFAQVLAETLAGSRPAQQLTPWTTEQARRRIKQLGPMLVSDQRPRVRRIVTFAPSQDALELTAVVGFGLRVRALAVRLERAQVPPYRTTGSNRTVSERWYCTEIESA